MSFDRQTMDFDFYPDHTGMPSDALRSMNSMVRTRVLENTLLCGSDMSNESRHGKH